MKSLHDLGRKSREPARPAAAPDSLREPTSPACAHQIGQELKAVFGTLTAGPMPDKLKQLTDALEDAFMRGELFDRPKPRRPS